MIVRSCNSIDKVNPYIIYGEVSSKLKEEMANEF